MKSIKIIEVPSEVGAGTRGASLGISALKIASLNQNSSFFAKYDSVTVEDQNTQLFSETEFFNAKRIDVIHDNLIKVCNTVANVINEENTFPIVLAGDHSSAYGTIVGIKKANPNKKLGVIWIDAHADLHTPYTTPSGNTHGMPLGMALADDNLVMKRNNPKEETIKLWNAIKNIGFPEPKIEPKDIVFVAVRETEGPEDIQIEKYNIRNFTAEEVTQKGVARIANEVLETLSDCDMIYVSFDVDSMDSKFSKGTGTPVKNGLSPIQAKELNAILVQNEKVVCWEIVEINPILDAENKMANISFEILEQVTKAIKSHRKY